MTSDPVTRVLDALRDYGSEIRAIADGHMAQCPAHNDRNPSLHVSEGADGRALVDCKAGCRLDDVLSPLGLTERDLFVESLGGSGSTGTYKGMAGVLAPRLDPVTDYVYTDAAGVPVMKVTRFNQVDHSGGLIGKTFRQYGPDGAGGWQAGLNGKVPPLYRLPEVLAAVATGGTVLVVEGEKDADRATSLGLVATTSPMGAGKWRDEHTASLTGGVVVVVVDDDGPGRAHALAVHEALSAVARSVVMVLPASGCKDLSEHLDAGYTLSALRPVLPEHLTQAPEQLPQDELHVRLAIHQGRVVMADGLDTIPVPTMLVHDLLQTDSLAWLQGKPGSCKTFLALDLAGAVGTGLTWHEGRKVRQGSVLYVIAEGAGGLRARVRAWESSAGRPMGPVAFLPMAVHLLDRVDLGAFCLLVSEMTPSLIVIDTQARATVGAEENSAKDMGLLVEALEQIRAASGATVLVVHHEGRSGDHLRGSTALEGAATTVMKVDRDGPELTLSCLKQKDGTEFEPIRFALVPMGESAICVMAGTSGSASLLNQSEQTILNFFRDGSETVGVPWTVIRDTSGLTRTTAYRAMQALVSRGELRNVGTAARIILVATRRGSVP